MPLVPSSVYNTSLLKKLKVGVRNWSGTLWSSFSTTKRNRRDRDMTALELLTMHLNSIRIPTNSQKIYKDECVFCFDTPVSSF